MGDLAARVQALPAELFNNILDFVLTPNTAELTATIDEDYKHPPQLHINQSIRERFAHDYYSNATFHIPSSEEYEFVTFLAALPPTHKNLIRSIRLRADIKIQARGQQQAHRELQSVRHVLRGYIAAVAHGKPLFALQPDTMLEMKVLVREKVETKEVLPKGMNRWVTREQVVKCRFGRFYDEVVLD